MFQSTKKGGRVLVPHNLVPWLRIKPQSPTYPCPNFLLLPFSAYFLVFLTPHSLSNLLFCHVRLCTSSFNIFVAETSVVQSNLRELLPFYFFRFVFNFNLFWFFRYRAPPCFTDEPCGDAMTQVHLKQAKRILCSFCLFNGKDDTKSLQNHA